MSETIWQMMEKRYRWRRLNTSFSGGKTSAEMTKQIVSAFGGRRRNHIITFANTGREHEETLRFVHEMDLAYDLGVVWLEAVFDPKMGSGTRHKVVSYETASREGEPFEQMIQKYGIPGPGYLHCTRELKLSPIRSYLRSVGWEPGTYDTAIGIRADEIDRIPEDYKERKFVYPMADAGIKKQDVIKAFEGGNINLNIEEALGNCVDCWKKSKRKHLWLMRNHPHVFDFPRRMEKLYSRSGGGDGRVRFFYRGHETVADLERQANQPDDEIKAIDPNFDLNDGCNETCEIDFE